MKNKLPTLIRELRKVRGWDQTDLAEHLGTTQGTVSRWESGKQEPEYDYLRAIAALDGKTVDAFLGYSVRVRTTNILPVTVRGALRAGAWVEAIEWSPDEHFEILVPEDKRYIGLTHTAYRVDGPSMNKLYPDGSFVVAVPYIELQMDPAPGDKVICQRTRADGLIEATIKEYAINDGRRFLWPRSDHPDHQAPIPLDPDGSEEITITGKVVGSYKPE